MWEFGIFVDSTPALACVIKGSSRQWDLNLLTGLLWFSNAARMRMYWGQYGRSASKLADGPSRGNFELMKQLQAIRIPCRFGELCPAAGRWLLKPQGARLVIQFMEFVGLRKKRVQL